MNDLVFLDSRRKYERLIMRSLPIAYWRLAEGSGTVVLDRMPAQRNGVHSNVSLGYAGIDEARRVAFYNGSTSYTDVFSASLAAAFSGAEGTLAVWGRMNGASVWTDGVARLLAFLGGGANFVRIIKRAGSNQLGFDYRAGGVTESVTNTTIGTGKWFFAAITWSVTNDRVRGFTNFAGSQDAFLSGLSTSLGTWGATPLDTAVLGATSTVPASVHNGYLQHTALWARELKEAQLRRFYQYMVGS